MFYIFYISLVSLKDSADQLKYTKIRETVLGDLEKVCSLNNGKVLCVWIMDTPKKLKICDFICDR